MFVMHPYTVAQESGGHEALSARCRLRTWREASSFFTWEEFVQASLEALTLTVRTSSVRLPAREGLRTEAPRPFVCAVSHDVLSYLLTVAAAAAAVAATVQLAISAPLCSET